MKQNDIDKIRAIKDSDIDLSDIPELKEDFWKRAKRIRASKKRKKK